MKKALLALLLALPAPSFAKAKTKVLKLEGGTLTVDGKYVGPGDAFPKRKSAMLARGATLVLETPMGKLLFHGPTVFTLDDTSDAETLDLKSGGVLSVLKHATGKTYSVRTPAAVAAVRGTTFFAETRGSDKMYLCVCDGTVDVKSEKSSFTTSIATNHEHRPFLFHLGPTIDDQKDDKMLGHTDEEIEALLPKNKLK